MHARESLWGREALPRDCETVLAPAALCCLAFAAIEAQEVRYGDLGAEVRGCAVPVVDDVDSLIKLDSGPRMALPGVLLVVELLEYLVFLVCSCC
jgi:hypothetical protein